MNKMQRNEQILVDAIVVRRTNFGEADRIINIVSSQGKFTVIAKGVRREKSKLAGGIELFCLSKLVLMRGKSDFYTLVSAKMVKFYQGVMLEMEKLEFVAIVMRKIEKIMEQVEDVRFFWLLNDVLEAIDQGCELDVIKAWFLFKFLHEKEEEVNLYNDRSGQKLEAGKRYSWDFMEKCLFEDEKFGDEVEMIKMMRILPKLKPGQVEKIKDKEKYLKKIIKIGESLN